MSSAYKGIVFDTDLQARWAAFFDLAGWTWQKDPVPIKNWKPEFRVTFNCGHSECHGTHTILISVLPIDNVNGVKGHPALSHCYSVEDSTGRKVADAGAVFGLSPNATLWEMAHGAGGGVEDVTKWIDNANALWSKAGANVSTLNEYHNTRDYLK